MHPYLQFRLQLKRSHFANISLEVGFVSDGCSKRLRRERKKASSDDWNNVCCKLVIINYHHVVQVFFLWKNLSIVSEIYLFYCEIIYFLIAYVT